jgi:L-ribulose-5-phosphate 3-epimerase
MFKKGVITDEISQDLKIAAGLALKYRLDGVEIRSVWEKGPHELDIIDIGKIKQILKDAGLSVCAISSPFFKCNIDNADEKKESLEILKKCIFLAQELETRMIRGFTFWRTGGFEEYISRIIDSFDKPVEWLEKENMLLVLESESNVFTTNASKLVRVIKGINSEHIKALWDPGNTVFDPDGEVPFPDGYEIIKPYMAHMHLKDAVMLPGGKELCVSLGQGQVNYTVHFKRLIEDGYSGYVVLETHYRPNHDIGEEQFVLPKGSAFSYLGYEATEECLVNWEHLLSGI